MSESKDIASVEEVIWELLAFRSPSTPARNDVVDRAIALLSALEKDALRYRWLRDGGNLNIKIADLRNASCWDEAITIGHEECDTAIDLARGKL